MYHVCVIVSYRPELPLTDLGAFWSESEPVPVVVHHAHGVIEGVALPNVERAQLFRIGEW